MKEMKIDPKWNSFLMKLFAIILQDGFICGGFVRNILLTLEKPVSTDIDIYCINEDAYKRLQDRLIGAGYVVEKETPMSINYKVLFKGDMPIQLVKPMDDGHVTTVGELEKIINNFDFTCIRAGVYFNGTEIKAIVDDDFEKDNEEKKLHIKNIHCPVAEIFRAAKYIEKGFYLPPLEAVKILQDWMERSEEYKIKLISFLNKENPTKEAIDNLERLLHID